MNSSHIFEEIVKCSYYDYAEMHYKKAIHYFRQKKYCAAIKKLKSAIKEIEKHINKDRWPDDNILSCEFKNDKFLPFVAPLDERFAEDQRNLAHYRGALGHVYYKQQQYSLAEKEYQLVIKIIKELNKINVNDHYYRILIICHIDCAIIFSEQNKYQDAIKEGTLAIAACEKIQDKTVSDQRNLANIRNTLAGDYFNNGQINAAIEQLEFAIKELKNIDAPTAQDHRYLAGYFNNIAIIYANKFELAMNELKSMDLNKSPDYHHLSECFNHFTTIHSGQGNDCTAIENLDYAMKELEKINLEEFTNKDLKNLQGHQKTALNIYGRMHGEGLKKIPQLENELQISVSEDDPKHEMKSVKIKQGKSALLVNSLLNNNHIKKEKPIDVLLQNKNNVIFR